MGRWISGVVVTAFVAAPLVAASLVATAARAGDDQPTPRQRPQDQGAVSNTRQAVGADETGGPTILEGIPALNGLDGARDMLRDRFGVYLHGEYIGDPYGNLAGGLKRGATYAGRLDVQLDVDTGKAVRLPGGTLHANLFQIHGRDLSRDFIGNILSINDIAALPTTRLYELWYEQAFGDKLSIRAGQQGIDVEFLTSSYGANFINATFGWPGLPSLDLPDGAPAYPLATPALRAKFTPTGDIAILAALFDGMPAGPCGTDPQLCDRHGTNFRLSDPPLALLEAQVRYNQGASATGLPGRIKLGTFAHFGRFDDQRFGGGGVPLAAGAAPILHSPDFGAYGILDQQVYRLPGAEDGRMGDERMGDARSDDDGAAKGVGIFARVIAAPPDRNPIDLYIDGGFTAAGLMPQRPDDLFGVAAAFARVSRAAIGADLDAAALGGPRPVRSFEAVIEATYQAQVVPGLTLQPTVQYIVHPGGNVADPYGDGTTAIPNALVFGVTTNIKF